MRACGSEVEPLGALPRGDASLSGSP